MPSLPHYSNASARKPGFGILDQKTAQKTALQEELGWPREAKRPMVCLPAGMSDALGGKLLQDVLPGLLSLPVEILVLGKGSPEYGAFFTKLAKEHHHRIHIMADSAADIEKMYCASDMALFLSEGTPAADIQHCLAMGAVPVSPEHKLLDDYNPVQETGNAFTYSMLTKWHCFGALVRAVETHKFPFDWKTIQRHGIESVMGK